MNLRLVFAIAVPLLTGYGIGRVISDVRAQEHIEVQVMIQRNRTLKLVKDTPLLPPGVLVDLVLLRDKRR